MTTPSFDILPAALDCNVVKGDEFGMSLDFDIALTNYNNWSAIVFKTTKAVSSNYPGGINTQGETAATFTVSVTSAANGQVNISLTETQTAALSEAELYRWYIRADAPGVVTRTFVSGNFKIHSP